MKSNTFFLVALLSALSISTIAFAQVEEITLSTYYPAPYGEYEEMAAEKLFADKMIIGNMDVDGDGIDSTPADIALMSVGSLLIENNVGIGTAWPNTGFHLHEDAWDTDVYIGNPPQTVHGHPQATASGIFVSSDTNLGSPGGYGGHVFFINKETGKTWHVGVGNDDSLRITETGVANSMNFLPAGNVGIGTQNPSAKLVINSGAYDFAHEVRIENDDPGEEAGIRFRSRNAANTAWLHADIGLYAEGGYLGFKVPHSNSVGGGYRMVIKDDGNVGIGTASPDASYRLDVNGRIKGGGTAQAWSANRTSYVQAAPGGPWTTIPGLSITFTLSRDALVQMMATGTQRTVGNYWIHCGYRFVIDGAPRGHGSHGQRIHVSRHWQFAWWNTWSISDFANLTAGTHTIEVQVRNSSTHGNCSTAIICGEVGPSVQDYTGGNLNIIAVYN